MMSRQFLAVALFLWQVPILAQDAPDPELDAATQRENPATRIPYESGQPPPAPCEDRWSDFLPIWGKDACARGYVLPRPFGISLGVMHQDQPFDVGAVFVNGIDVKMLGIAVVDEVQNEETTVTLRFDAWLFPFWNVYGILGKTDGEAIGPLAVDLEPIFPIICGLPGNNCAIDTTFELDYRADVVGVGTTVAGGYKDFFGMIDLNYTEADLNISTTDAEATVISARIGWNGQLGGFTGVLWVGSMYQDIEQVFELQLDIGNDLTDVVVEQSTQAPFNFIIGGQWDINRSFSILAELGLGQRQSQMLNVAYRF